MNARRWHGSIKRSHDTGCWRIANAPLSLTSDESYPVSAGLLFPNKSIRRLRSSMLRTLPLAQMPNRDGFVPESRPDVPRPWRGCDECPADGIMKGYI